MRKRRPLRRERQISDRRRVMYYSIVARKATQPPEPAPPILFLGTIGTFSLGVLRQLCAAQTQIVAVAVPAENPDAPPVRVLHAPQSVSPLPLLNAQVRQSIIELAWDHAIPVVELGTLDHPTTQAMLASYQAELGCVACFPKRLPERLLRMPERGWLNVHPSLLPKYRGPAPLFWTLHNGSTYTGVTTHWMDAEFDTGPIALQRYVHFPEGASYRVAEECLAQIGGDLLVDTLALIQSGLIPRRPQAERPSYAPWPEAADFVVDPGWSARRAFVFLRGVADWGEALYVQLPERHIRVETALGFDPDGQLEQPYRIRNDELWLQCQPGVLRVRLAATF